MKKIDPDDIVLWAFSISIAGMSFAACIVVVTAVLMVIKMF